MSDLKEKFADEADFDLNDSIEQAFRMTSPNFRGFMAWLSNLMGVDYADEIYEHLRGKIERAGGHPVLDILPPVAPLEEQKAADRQKFPTLVGEGRADTRRMIETARCAARTLLETLHKNPDLPDADKLLLVQNARLHLYSIAVYYDRLENTNPKDGLDVPPPPAAQ